MTGWSEKTLNASLVSLPISVMCAWLTLHCCVPSLVPPIHQKVKCGVTVLFQVTNLSPDSIPLRKGVMQATREPEIGVLWALVCPPCRSLFLIMKEQVPVLLLPGNSVKSHGAQAANGQIGSTENPQCSFTICEMFKVFFQKVLGCSAFEVLYSK